MAAKKEQLYIWSLRFSPARGWHVEKERTADNEREAQLWLDVFRNDEPRIDFIASVKPPKIDMENLTFAKATTARKANPAPRKRAAKRAPSLYGAKMKHLESALSALNMLIDKGAEFPDAVIKVSESTGIDSEVLTAEYDNYWRAWSELSSAYRKTNPAKRPAPKKRAISRPSQVTKKAPSKRLVARRKVAAKKPVKGYFPNPLQEKMSTSKGKANFPYLVQRQNTENWNTSAAFKTKSEAFIFARELADKYPRLPIRVMHYTGGPM